SALYTDPSGEPRSSLYVWDLTERSQRDEALRVITAELSRALAEGPPVQGMLPICAYCKRIRQAGHDWQSVEGYIAAHIPVRLPHGTSPTAYQPPAPPEGE